MSEAELVVRHPPGEDENGKLLNFICDPDLEGCGHAASAFGSFKVDNFKHRAKCPNCGKSMVVDMGAMIPSAKGTRASKRRKAKDLTLRNERMATKQWDNHDVGIDRKDVQSGRRKIRNPTPGGPLDPNSKFNKKTR